MEKPITPPITPPPATFREIMQMIYLFSPGIIFLFIYYFITVWFSIGQDMVMQTVEYTGPLVFVNLSLLAWMAMAWLSSRRLSNLYIEINSTDDNDLQNRPLLKHFPRLLGYNVAVGLQLAAFNLPTTYSLWKSGWFAILFIVGHCLYYILVHKALSTTRKVYRIPMVVLGVGYIAFLLYVFLHEPEKGKNTFDRQYIWLLLAILYFFIQILFVWLAIHRRKGIRNQTTSERRWKIGYRFVLVVAVLLYAAILIWPKMANEYGALSCLLLAMGLWVAFVCFVKSIALRLKFRLTVLVLLWAIVMGMLNDPYHADLQKADKPNVYSDRPNVDKYLEEWFAYGPRANAINALIQKQDTLHPYPVYLVIADGGASKSGYWVASVLSKLEASDNKDKFSTHLLSMAGASGGTVGNAAFYATLAGKDYKPAPLKGISQYEAASFLETDFFTYSLAHFLGPDLLRHLTAFFPARDRASALEHAMECSDYSPQIGAYFSQPLENLFTSDYHLPIWFINTTNLDTGEPGVVSNVKIKQPWTHRRDILNEVDHDQCSGNPQLMKLSTAAVIGARFPYISPAGTINEEHYVDGGYYDNSGGGITLELMQLIEKKMHDTTSPLHKLLGYVKFKVIYISNGTNKVKKTQLHPLANDLAAPLLTVLGTYSNQTTLGNSRLEDCIMSSELRLPDPYRTLNLPMNTTDTEDYPMNWVLSDNSIKRMERNLDSVNPKKILWGYPTEENSPKAKNKIKLPEKHL